MSSAGPAIEFRVIDERLIVDTGGAGKFDASKMSDEKIQEHASQLIAQAANLDPGKTTSVSLPEWRKADVIDVRARWATGMHEVSGVLLDGAAGQHCDSCSMGLAPNSVRASRVTAADWFPRTAHRTGCNCPERMWFSENSNSWFRIAPGKRG